jgi:hypothetical protein
MSATKWLKFTNWRPWRRPGGRRLGAALKLPLRLRLSGLLGRDRGSAVGVRREQNLDAATLVSGHQVARCRWAFLAENAHAIPARSLIAKGIICEVRD